MPGFSLNLDKIRISCQEKKFELAVESTSFFKCPDGKSQHWEKPELLEHLSSGKVWVSRGNNYRLDFQILINDRKCSQNVIDGLGNHVRNLPVWSQVSMEPRLEVSASKDSKISFSIKLNHTFPKDILSPLDKAVSPVPADVQVPEKTVSVQLERVEIHMNFKISQTPDVELKGRDDEFLELLGGNKYCAEELNLHEACQGLSGHQALWQVSQKLSKSSDFSSRYDFGGLMNENEEMLDNGIVPSQSDNTTPSIPSRLSTPSSQVRPLSPISYNNSAEDTAINRSATSSNFDFGCVCKMVDYALRTLIGGRQTKQQIGIKILKPYPTNSLSGVAPSLWSPGFLQAISQRSQFLPIISRSLSTSLLCNVQSPSLRRKLMGLGLSQSQPEGDYGLGRNTGRDAADISLNIRQTMQANIWMMMQLSLHNPVAARRLQPFDSEIYDSCMERDDEMLDSFTTQGDMSKQQSLLGNKVVDPEGGGLQSRSYDNACNVETEEFDDCINHSQVTNDEPFFHDHDEPFFDNLFHDDAEGSGCCGLEGLSKNVLDDACNNEIGSDVFTGSYSLMGDDLAPLGTTKRLEPNMQRVSLLDKQGRMYFAINAETGADCESMLV